MKTYILVASSDIARLQERRKLLEENHVANKQYFDSIPSKRKRIPSNKKMFVKCFGKLIAITEKQRSSFKSQIILTK